MDNNRFEASTDPCPFPEYPRPQLEREDWMNLNGLYDYTITGNQQELPTRFEGKILVPFAIESELSGVGKTLLAKDRLWYRRFFELDERFAGKRALLHFGAVDWICNVYIFCSLEGGHRGG